MIGEKSRERTEGKRGERNLARPLIRNLIRIRVRSHGPFIGSSRCCFTPVIVSFPDYSEKERERNSYKRYRIIVALSV